MRFLPTEEQSDFARTLHGLLAASDVPAAVRAWGAGDHTPAGPCGRGSPPPDCSPSRPTRPTKAWA